MQLPPTTRRRHLALHWPLLLGLAGVMALKAHQTATAGAPIDGVPLGSVTVVLFSVSSLAVATGALWGGRWPWLQRSAGLLVGTAYGVRGFAIWAEFGDEFIATVAEHLMVALILTYFLSRTDEWRRAEP